MEAALHHVAILEKILDEHSIPYPPLVKSVHSITPIRGSLPVFNQKKKKKSNNRMSMFCQSKPQRNQGQKKGGEKRKKGGWALLQQNLNLMTAASAADMPPPPPTIPASIPPPIHARKNTLLPPELPPPPAATNENDALLPPPPPPPHLQLFRNLMVRVGPKEECQTLDEAIRCISEAGKLQTAHITIQLFGLHVIHSSLSIVDETGVVDSDLELSQTLEIPFSNLHIVGEGQEKTTIVGMLHLNGVENVVFENLTITNPSDASALTIMNGGDVSLEFCEIGRCGKSAVINFGGKIKMSKCRIHDNFGDAIYADGKKSRVALVNCVLFENSESALHALNFAKIDVLGDQTLMHSNGNGITATDHGIINLRYNRKNTNDEIHCNHQMEDQEETWNMLNEGTVQRIIETDSSTTTSDTSYVTSRDRNQREMEEDEECSRVTLIPKNSAWSTKAKEQIPLKPPPRCSTILNIADLSTISNTNAAVLRVGPSHVVKTLRNAFKIVRRKLQITTILLSGLHVLSTDEEDEDELDIILEEDEEDDEDDDDNKVENSSTTNDNETKQQNEEEEEDYNVLLISRSNLNIIGENDSCTIIGTLKIKNQTNVKLEKLIITSPLEGPGLWLQGKECEVEAVECVFSQSAASGAHCENGAKFLFVKCEFHHNQSSGLSVRHSNTIGDVNNCMFHHNLESGLHVYDCAVTNIHGDESRANNNSKYGLLAWNSGQIHLHVNDELKLASGNGLLNIQYENVEDVVDDVLVF